MSVTYRLDGSVATIAMDDGKRNVLSLDTFGALGAAFDRADADRAVVLLTGRPGAFSAGFDLHVLQGGGAAAHRTVLAGFELAARILSFPAPVVVACSGHAIAMGAFLVLAGDYRVGAAGDHRIGANEVAIGITMPFFGIELCRRRLAPAHVHRAVVQAELYRPDEAVAAGFLDRVVPADGLMDAARDVATRLARLDRDVHAATKLRAGGRTLEAVRAAIEADDAHLRALL